MYVRIRKHPNGRIDLSAVKSEWTSKGPRQRIVGHLCSFHEWEAATGYRPHPGKAWWASGYNVWSLEPTAKEGTKDYREQERIYLAAHLAKGVKIRTERLSELRSRVERVLQEWPWAKELDAAARSALLTQTDDILVRYWEKPIIPWHEYA